MAGAIEATRQKLSVTLLDENPTLGGQIYRNIGNVSHRMHDVLGKDYLYGQRLVDSLDAAHADIRLGASVWNVSHDKIVHFTQNGAVETVKARSILIATGAMERPFPIAGWTLPGVMTAGAAQIAMKTDALVPQGRVVLAGCGPLLYLVAKQLNEANVDIRAVLDTTPLANYIPALRHLPRALTPPGMLFKGIGLVGNLSRQPFPVIRGVDQLEIHGDDRAHSITYHKGRRTGRFDADYVLLHQGVVPSIQLAQSMGCALQWNDLHHCFAPRLDEFRETSISDVYVAGDGGGILGARAAECSARIAVGRIAKKMLGVSNAALIRDMSAQLRRHTGIRTFIDTLYCPSLNFRVPTDPSTTICRCESVQVGEIRNLAAMGCQGPNQVKFYSRCGMGSCQGRNCGLTVTETMAHASGQTPEQVGYYRIRPPVRPLTLGEIASTAQDGEIVQLEFS